MSKLFFRPWVGSAYATGGIFGKRVMVLGESHRRIPSYLTISSIP